MSNLQNASLVLNTLSGIDISTNTIKTAHQWTNINMRTLLGDMYDKYDIFNLCLNTIATSVSTTTFNKTTKDLQIIIRVSGLPFINNTYSIQTNNNCNTPYCTIGTFLFVSGNSTYQYFYGSNIATFGKNQDISNITIDYIRVSDLLQPEISSGYKFPDTTFIFDIFGIEKDGKNSNGTRLNIN
jgi:hypothetical protein